MQRSEQVNELAAALAKAQSEMSGAAKDSANPFFKSKYADLASTWDACRVSLTKNGLSVVQLPEAEGNRVAVHTILLHASGQWISAGLTLTAKEDSPQAVGSAITYARRYGLAAIVGVAPEDDDGEAAEARSWSGKPIHRPRQDVPAAAGSAAVIPPPDATQRAAEAIVEQVEAVTAQPMPEHVKPLFERILQQADPRGPGGTHTADQVAYSMKLLSDAASAINLPAKMDAWTQPMVRILTKHFFKGQ